MSESAAQADCGGLRSAWADVGWLSEDLVERLRPETRQMSRSQMAPLFWARDVSADGIVIDLGEVHLDGAPHQIVEASDHDEVVVTGRDARGGQPGYSLEATEDLLLLVEIRDMDDFDEPGGCGHVGLPAF
jgi:hypothetical protein